MAAHFLKSRTATYLGVSAAVVAVLAASGVAVALHEGKSASAAGRRPPAATTTTVAPAPLTVSLTSPSEGATGVAGDAPIVLSASAPLPAGMADPTITPAVPGSWAVQGETITFTPTVALIPSSTYRIVLAAGIHSAGGGAVMLSAASYSFTTAPGSTLRLQEVLAQLGYLPLSWTQTPGTPAVPAGQAVYAPPSGTFAWTWVGAPAALTSQWAAGAPNVLTRGAVMAFESDHGLATDGIAGPEVWTALLAAEADPAANMNQHGYTYALADQATSPQSLTVWHDGTLISQTPANTGIPQSPTTPGTFPVYERLATQIMKGTNPNGTPYADPVAWVAYFYNGEAIHYIARSYYGSFQSLGCVEVAYSTGAHIWPYLTIGTLVTVVP